MVDLASAAVVEVYSQYLPQLEGEVAVEVTIANNEIGRPVIDGTTDYNPGPGRCAKVVIKLPSLLPNAVFFSMFYVALHEIGVHAVQELYAARAPIPPARYHAFAEGLVDQAITTAVQSRAKTYDPKTDRLLGAIKQRRDARGKDERKNAINLHREIHRGTRAFGTLVQLGAELESILNGNNMEDVPKR